jgi:hypothetical protein
MFLQTLKKLWGDYKRGLGVPPRGARVALKKTLPPALLPIAAQTCSARCNLCGAAHGAAQMVRDILMYMDRTFVKQNNK